jgi:N-acetylneuraminic acid mutarotase
MSGADSIRINVRLIATSTLSPSFPGLSSHASATGPRLKGVLVCGGEGGPRVLNSADDSLFLFTNENGGDCGWSAKRLPNDVSLLGHAVATVDNDVFLFGGRQGGSMGDSPDSNTILQFNENKWVPVDVVSSSSSLTSGQQQPEPRSYHAMTGARGRFFVFGGCSGHSRLNDLWSFDVASRQWTLLHPGNSSSNNNNDGVPHVRGGSAIFVNAAEDTLFVVMGFAGKQLGDIWQFDLASKSWSLVPDSTPRPEPRSVFASASIGDQFYLFGGEREPSATGHSGAGTFFDDAWRFDAQTRTWKQVLLENGPSARGWCAMSATAGDRGQQHLVLSGGLNDRNERLSEVYSFDL